MAEIVDRLEAALSDRTGEGGFQNPVQNERGILVGPQSGAIGYPYLGVR